MSMTVKNGLNLEAIAARVKDAVPDALLHGAEHVMDVAKERAPLLVDVERANREERPGTLRESAYTKPVDETTVEMGFKDFIAARMHEHTDLHHDVGQSKFLESAMVTERAEARRVIAKELGEAL